MLQGTSGFTINKKSLNKRQCYTTVKADTTFTQKKAINHTNRYIGSSEIPTKGGFD